MDTLPEQGFAELLAMSHFSFLKSATAPEELVEQAARLGYRAIAITDECSLAGVVRAHQAAKQHPIKLIVGAQFRFARTCTFAGQRIAMLAKNRQGYSQLCRLITHARRRADKGDYLFTREDLQQDTSELLVLLCPDEAHKTGFPELLQWCKAKHPQDLAMAFTNTLSGYDQAWLHWLQGLSSLYGVTLFASSQPLMSTEDQKPLLDLLTAIDLNQSLDDAKDKLLANAERRLHSQTVLATRYPSTLLNNALELAQRCVFSMDELRYQYPREIAPTGVSPMQYLRQLAWEGAYRRFQSPLPEKIIQQLEHELALIEDLEYEPYFLTVYDIVRFARTQGILCQGRGSAANSTVCYCLGITEVDPNRMAMLFERFISKERNEPPDIDVDFEHHRREEVIQYIYEKYGRHRAALVASVVVYRPRSAIRDAGKALGLPAELIDQLAKSQDGGYSRHLDTEHAKQAGIPTDEPAVARCLYFAEQLLGYPRHLSQHTGGFVIARDTLEELVPVENASMADRSVIQWDKDALETMGLLKVDVLALGMLTAVQNTLNALAVKKEAPRSLQDIPAEDPETYAMISAADTVGLFQVESRAQMSMLPRLRPACYYDLVVQVAIVRPGPIQGGMVHPYLLRRQGIAPVSYPSEALKQALGRTLGVPIFQEQVMQIAILAAGFSPGEADQLRRSMAAWKRKGGLQHFYDRVVGGMVQRGYDPEFAKGIFRQIEGFGEYGFPESHAASFALIVYVSAWLKRHHPDAYLCGLLNAQPMGFYQPAQLIQDARRHGVQVEPIDLHHSGWQTTLEQTTHQNGLHRVRLGFHLVQGLSANGAHRLLESRKNGEFTSVEDLAKRATLSKQDLQALADANALACITGNRKQAWWATTGLNTVHGDLLTETRREESDVTLKAPSQFEEMVADYRSWGASLNHHPIAFLRDQLKAARIEPAHVLKTYPDRRLARACGLVTHRQRPATAKGTVFLTLEDESGSINVIVWNTLAEAQRQTLRNAAVMGVFGVWQNQNGVCSLLAKKLVDYTPLLNELKLKSRDFH
ncbi:error-prone DNA polymerase [Limnobacter sp.]|uniref:error-prone DNA polymerase n=1 Tax=Limnobacter sp. TaxID=2003368 RepID=UPI00258A6539|nr:error-prone DNA polymerase [Limnobacter sp.]